MALSAEELAMLNTLLYQGNIDDTYSQALDESKNGPLSVGHMLDMLQVEKDGWASRETYEALRQRALDDPSISSLRVKDLTSTTGDVELGSRKLCLYSDADGDGNPEDVYVIYMGTAGEAEWTDNVEGLSTADTAGQQDALAYYHRMTQGYDPSVNVVVSGHSKGGNKAMYVAALDSTVDSCVAFDGQGFSQDFLDEYADAVARNRDKIWNYYNQGDYVSCLMGGIAGHEVPLDSGDGCGFDPADHAPVRLFADAEGGDLSLRTTDEVAGYREPIRRFTQYADTSLTQEQQEALAPLLGPLVNCLGNLGDESKRDDALRELRETLRDNPEALGTLVAVAVVCPDTVRMLLKVAGVDVEPAELTAEDLRNLLASLLGVGVGRTGGEPPQAAVEPRPRPGRRLRARALPQPARQPPRAGAACGVSRTHRIRPARMAGQGDSWLRLERRRLRRLGERVRRLRSRLAGVAARARLLRRQARGAEGDRPSGGGRAVVRREHLGRVVPRRALHGAPQAVQLRGPHAGVLPQGVRPQRHRRGRRGRHLRPGAGGRAWLCHARGRHGRGAAVSGGAARLTRCARRSTAMVTW